MTIFGRLLLLFLIVPAIELALLIRVGQWVGFWPTLAMILLTGVAGSYLAKREGLGIWRQFNENISSGGLPGRELMDGIIILCSGALLLAPGVLTDVAGMFGLFPPTRSLIRKYALRRIERTMRTGTLRVGLFGGFGPGGFGAPPNERGDAWAGTPRETPTYTNSPGPAVPPRHPPPDELSN